MKNTIIFFIMALLASCADSKTFVIDGQTVEAEPYGWANSDAMKNDSVIYEASVGNVVWSVILIETLVVPVWLTGWELFEPVRKRGIVPGISNEEITIVKTDTIIPYKLEDTK